MRPEPEQYRAWADAAARALRRWYNPRTGLWKTAGWWNCANALTALIQHSQRTGQRRYLSVIETTFGRAQRVNPEFSTEYYDDDGWWALAWIAAFDLIGAEKYLDLARKLFAGMAAGWDDTCGGAARPDGAAGHPGRAGRAARRGPRREVGRGGLAREAGRPAAIQGDLHQEPV
jgi:predicted alpha-1,6-mannanase (GH76 family)